MLLKSIVAGEFVREVLDGRKAERLLRAEAPASVATRT
jgi:hypothetical protein